MFPARPINTILEISLVYVYSLDGRNVCSVYSHNQSVKEIVHWPLRRRYTMQAYYNDCFK